MSERETQTQDPAERISVANPRRTRLGNDGQPLGR